MKKKGKTKIQYKKWYIKSFKGKHFVIYIYK